jgi:hypothetical protein
VFLASLPRRVDSVEVTRGATISGPVMSVSGATLEIVATATATDAALLAVGAVGAISVEGTDVPVTVSAVTKGTGTDASTDGGSGGNGKSDGAAADSGRYTVNLLPGTLTDAQLTALQGTNVRVTIPVSSTGGEVLAVPLAALTAGPGGESRIELASTDGTTALVTVETGLAAGGYVEITTSESPLEAGDLVVVGTGGTSGGSTASPTADATTEAKG